MTRERVIFLTAKNPFTKKDWSGITYYMFQHLNEQYDVEYVTAPTFTLLKKLGYYFSKFLSLFNNKKYLFEYGVVLAWFYGRHYNRKLKGKKGCAFILVPAGFTEIAFLKTNIPVISVGDCSFLQLINYYPSLGNVMTLSKYEVDFVERRALKKITLAFFSSSWATEFVKNHFEHKNILTIPFGANVNHPNVNSSKVLGQGICQLLFIGVDWERKGGETALAIHRRLREMNTDSHLTIIGSVPRKNLSSEDRVTLITNLDKDSAAGETQFQSILQQADFFLLPTKADCTPIAIAESFSAGVPVLATRTGGISSMITDGVNGFLFDQNNVTGYVNRIIQLRNEVDLYQTISVNCIRSYYNLFNWKSWAHGIEKEIGNHLK